MTPWRIVAAPLALALALASNAPAQAILHEWRGVPYPLNPPIGDQFGTTVANVGDVDGDGVSDAGVGAPVTNVGTVMGAGSAFVFSGASGALLQSHVGAKTNGFFAWSIAPIGDVDNDGRDDYVIGEHDGAPSAPWLRLYSGRTGVMLRPLDNYTHAAGPGDVDGDSIPDLFMGDWNSRVNGQHLAGSADLLSGAPLLGWPRPMPDAGLSKRSPGSMPWTRGIFGYEGVRARHRFGLTRRAGDVDADGVPDLLVGAVGYWPFTVGDGFWVYSGATGDLLYRQPPLSSSFPSALDGVGDVNGDGFDDIAASDLGPVTVAPYHHVTVFGGPDGTPLFVLQSPFANQEMSDSVAGAGDVDGDGYADILAGGARGVLAQTFLFSGRDQSVLFHTTNGGHVSGLGDTNGDDFPDFLAGSFWDPVLQASTARLYSGAPDGVATVGVGCPDGRGVIPRISQTSKAAVGTSFAINLSRTSSGLPAVLVLGLSSTTWGAVPLPIDLASLGLSGCLLRVSPDVTVLSSTNGPPELGRTRVPLVVPNVSGLAGQRLFAQWLVLDPSGAGRGAATRALDITVQ